MAVIYSVRHRKAAMVTRLASGSLNDLGVLTTDVGDAG